jgi:glycosyltransferase involved in cell wall biosynthesis
VSLANNHDLAIIGSYPPPEGGASIHVYRLSKLLDNENIHYIIYNCVSSTNNGKVKSVKKYRMLWLLAYAIYNKNIVTYCLSDRVSVWFFLIVFNYFKKRQIIIRVRNEKILTDFNTKNFKSFILRWCFQNVNDIICVSKEIKKFIEAQGICKSKVKHFPGFLPPPIDHYTMEDECLLFFQKHSPVMLIMGLLPSERNDIYNINLTLKVLQKLKNNYKDIGLIIVFRRIDDKQDTLQKFKAQVAKMNLTDSIQILIQPKYFLSIIQKVDVFLRPTSTDGDSNSIREALYYGTKCLASNSVTRPKGTYIFEDGNEKHYYDMLDELLLRKVKNNTQNEMILTKKNEYLSYLHTKIKIGST